MFRLQYDPVEKRRISTTDQVTTNRHAIITLVLRQAEWHTVLSNTRHIQAISRNFVACTMDVPTAVARSSTDWDRLARTNIATSSVLQLVRTVCGRPVRTSFPKLSLPCEKRRCHNTALQLNPSSP